MQVAVDELDATDAQRKRIAGWLVRFGFAGGQLEQAGQVKATVLGKQHLVTRFVELDGFQVQRFGPQAVEREVGVQPLEPDLFLAGLADLQAPQCQLQAEGVEFDPFEVGRHRRVLGQLLVGDAQCHTGKNEKAEQAVEGHKGQECASGASQSFVHVSLRLSKQECLEYGTLNQFRRGDHLTLFDAHAPFGPVR